MTDDLAVKVARVEQSVADCQKAEQSCRGETASRLNDHGKRIGQLEKEVAVGTATLDAKSKWWMVAMVIIGPVILAILNHVYK